MKLTRMIAVVLLIFVSSTVLAHDVDGLKKLAQEYFHAKVATQQPDATPEELETYLALLSDDIGYEHKPYRLLEEGLAETKDGKKRMREGMTYYLGGNEKYAVELDSVAIGFNAIAIQYSGVHEYRRGFEGPILTEQFTAMEVLEVVDGKIAIIREYRD